MEGIDSTRPNRRLEAFIQRLNQPDGGLVSSEDFRKMRPTRQQKTGEYLADLIFEEQIGASDTAEQFQSDTPLGDVVALIPVAAHQEAPNVYRSLAQYARQDSLESFSVALLLNAPENADETQIAATIDEIERAKSDFPKLDVRYSEVLESDTIGALRRRLWNAALLLARHEGRFANPSAEVIGLNHDIDTHRIAQRYITNIRRHFQRRQKHMDNHGFHSEPMLPVSTLMKHAHDLERPNISDVVFWSEYSSRQARRGNVYEASLAIPFRYYIERGGFDAEATSYETRKFYEGILPVKIAGSFIETSPRRYIERLQAHPVSAVWTKDSFGDSDTCRNNDPVGDISESRKHELIADTIQSAVSSMIVGATLKLDDHSQKPENSYLRNKTHYPLLTLLAAQILTQKRQQASAVLDRFVGSPANIQHLHDSFNIADAAQHVSTNVADGKTYHF